MKRMILVFLLVLSFLALAACGDGKDAGELCASGPDSGPACPEGEEECLCLVCL